MYLYIMNNNIKKYAGKFDFSNYILMKIMLSRRRCNVFRVLFIIFRIKIAKRIKI